MAEETTKSARPKVQTKDDVVAQAKEDAMSPEQKHKNYLETLERLHAESVVGPDGKTPSTGQLAASRGLFVAQVIEEGAAPSSNLVQGEGTNTAFFTMPSGVALDVQTVVATVDNSGGAADATVTVTIRDQAGEVIDANAQEDTIPAGGTGTATFARRLAGKGGGLRFGKLNVGNWLNVRTTGDLNPDTGGVTFEVEKSEFGVYVTDAVTGAFHVEAPFMFYDVGGGIYRIINSSLVEVNTDDFEVIADTYALTTNGGVTLSVAATGEVDLTLKTNKPFTVNNHLGNPIFRVDEDGDLHGLTGKALVFDL